MSFLKIVLLMELEGLDKKLQNWGLYLVGASRNKKVTNASTIILAPEEMLGKTLPDNIPFFTGTTVIIY